jgi:hypothetical protein
VIRTANADALRGGCQGLKRALNGEGSASVSDAASRSVLHFPVALRRPQVTFWRSLGLAVGLLAIASAWGLAVAHSEATSFRTRSFMAGRLATGANHTCAIAGLLPGS